ncbi:MAG: sulfurtransferase TusA family protein [Fibrobacteraceae bacterium]|nr:sulfurtransferase TusA family protein [Fibrobacteraceae bacterium]
MSKNQFNRSPLERWLDANKDASGLDDSLRLLLGHALLGVFRKKMSNFPIFSPEKALSLAERLPKEVLPAKFGDWISSPEDYAPAIVEFCESVQKFSFPETLNLADYVSGPVDLRAVRCPLGSVRARLVLAAMEKGEDVDILLDDGQPIENVPRAMIEDGNSIVFREKKENYWLIKVRKSANTK